MCSGFIMLSLPLSTSGLFIRAASVTRPRTWKRRVCDLLNNVLRGVGVANLDLEASWLVEMQSALGAMLSILSCGCLVSSSAVVLLEPCSSKAPGRTKEH